MPDADISLEEVDHDLAEMENDPDFVNDIDALVEDTPDIESIPTGMAKNITESVAGVPLVYNARVQMFMNYFQGRGRERFEMWLERSGAYVPMMQKILTDEGLPGDLVYLALIESGFSPYAYSHASAVGFWQFIAPTGRRYGLRIDGWIDERRNPAKATHAAALYLKDLHGLFGDWHLAAAGYNAGEGKIARAIRMYDTGSYWELVEHRYLKPETKEYVPKLIAAITIAKNPKTFGFNPNYYEPNNWATVTVPGGTDLSRLAYAAGVSFAAMKRMNTELRRWSTPPDMKEYPLHVPQEVAGDFAERLAAVPPDIGTPFMRIKLAKRETLASIAKRYKVSLEDLRCLNPKAADRAGENVLIPVGDDGTRYAENAQKQSLKTRMTVKARRGDTIQSLAKRYRVSASVLAEYNGLSGNRLKAGQRIKIPGKSIRKVAGKGHSKKSKLAKGKSKTSRTVAKKKGGAKNIAKR
jgi:membrane-bound lytic murein transglycosylase D